MATREIKTRFALEGEQKFKSTMKDSANAIKVLNSEQKLAKAQFQQTGDAEKYAAQQAEILKKKIEEQKAAVAAAEEAVKQLSENGVAENSRQMQQWKIRLNDAQTALANMETELQNVGSESSEATTQTEELGDSLSSLDKKASIAAVVSSVGKLSDGLGSALLKVKDLAAGLVSELRSAASWADDLATTALVYGMDTETLQRMQYASNIIDTDVETIIKSRQKLEQAMRSARPALTDEEFKKGTTSVNEYEQAFAQLGVEIMRYGQYRNWEDVFWEAGDALMHMTDGLDDFEKANAEVIRDTTAQQLFGKSWRELLPLFTAGREGYAKAMSDAAVVSEEDVDKLTQLDDALQSLQNQFDVLQRTVLAQLAPTLTDLSNALAKVLGEFNEYLQTDEGQEMLNGLSEAIQALFSDITNADFSSALETVKGALASITDALGWIKDNKDSVVNAVKAIVGAWMALKVTSGMTTVLQLINGLRGLGGAGAAAGAAAGAGTPTVTPTTTPTVDATPRGTPVGGAAGGAAATSFAMKVGTSKIGMAAANAAPTVGNIAGVAIMGATAIGDKTEFGRTLRDGGTLGEAFNAAAETVRKTFSTENLNAFVDNWNPNSENANVIAKAVGSVLENIRNPNSARDVLEKNRAAANKVTAGLDGSNPELEEAWQLFADEVNADSSAATAELLKELAGRYTAFLNDEDPVMDALIDNLSEETGDALTDTLESINAGDMPDPFDAIQLVEKVRKELETVLSGQLEGQGADLYATSEADGENAAVGLANGINAKASLAIDAAEAMAAGVSAAISGILRIASPSRVMMELGEYVGQGFAEGIESQIGIVNQAAERMASAVEIDTNTGSRSGSGQNGMIDVTLMIGSEQLAEVLVPLVNDSIGEEISLVRR